MVLYMLYTCEKQKTLGSIRKNFKKICVVLVDNGKIQLFWDNVFSKAARYDSMIRIRFDCPEWMCGGNMVKTMAFGDGENDIEMLNYVQIGVAMGNADNSVNSDRRTKGTV